jgi:hypothetical protein
MVNTRETGMISQRRDMSSFAFDRSSYHSSPCIRSLNSSKGRIMFLSLADFSDMVLEDVRPVFLYSLAES